MASLRDRILSYGRSTKVFTEDEATRSVLVTNIPRQISAEEIVIHFQRVKNGGGDIDHVHIPKKGTAVITFESIEVAKKVLEYSHKLGGCELRPQRFVPKEPSEVFRQVEAHINFEKFHVSPKDSQNMLDVLKENTEVEYRNGPKNCILVGTFNQIEAAHKLLQHLIQMVVGKEATEIHRDNDTASAQQDSTRAFDDAETTSFEVQPQFMNLLKQLYKSKLQGMEENFGVKILWDKNASQVHICQNEMSQGQSRFQDGCDAFIDLYQEFHPKMRREEVQIPHEANEAQILETINHVQAENPAIVEKVENILVVYAEKDSVSSSAQALKEELGLTKEGSNRKTRRSQQNSSRDLREDNESQQLGRFPLAQRLNQDLRNGVSFSLYQGDITDERVDAIVNAANECLHHGAGVAGAIVRKGGPQIQDESDRITRRHGSLHVGRAAYTSGGILPCRYVIHAVGPRWNEHGREGCISLLRQACLESLHVAAQLALSSIAFTAISSGIFGMPKDICAQVMFKAIEEFSASDAVNFSTLRDLRIVIIDDPTLSVFQEEFVKRYRSKGTSLQAAISQGLSSYNGPRETSLAANPKKELLNSNENNSLPSFNKTQRSSDRQLAGKTKTDTKAESPGNGTGRDEESREQPVLPNNLKQSPISNQTPATKKAKTKTKKVKKKNKKRSKNN